MSSVYVIAEAGSTHDEEYTNSVNLVLRAAQAGADAVKFQFWSSPERMRSRRRVDNLHTYTRGSIAVLDLKHLSGLAHRSNVDFLCTVYLPEDIETVAPYVDKFKVSSFEAGDTQFVLDHCKYNKEVIVSLGMHGALDMFVDLRGIQRQIKYLHCVSSYPVPLDQATLAALKEWDLDGYSDHTRNVLTGAVAVGAGARILEVHFRLDNTLKTCPDYPVSLSPTELTQYINNVRLAERLMGDGIKRPQACEKGNMKFRVTG